MRLRNALPLLMVLLLTTFAMAQKVNTDYDRAATFSNYHTYAWTAGTPVPNQLMDGRIRDSIDQQLASKGLQKVTDPEKADLIVAYEAALGHETQMNTTDLGGWGGWGGYRYGGMGGMSTTTVQNIPVGQLIVLLGDNKTKKVVWRATASDTLSDKPEKNTKKVQKAASKMFKNYPPKA
ncbi:DUF4136 domain-containing protein [Edaphobacter bradus]|uniref:DUF4136 domain-containing protein n=1 Tax=Edaphobacter bradus TaxID=2259016 RepID=UPI0021E04469|nr:DUF4136 domain-containing protein [Edaphobacter bradus]